MEPVITLLNTDFDVENKKFTDRIQYDGYEFSVSVSEKDIDKVCADFDYLFFKPKMSYYTNMMNMTQWQIEFYDDKGRSCHIEKVGKLMFITLPLYRTIRTDITSGAEYLRILHDSMRHLMNIVYPAVSEFSDVTY